MGNLTPHYGPRSIDRLVGRITTVLREVASGRIIPISQDGMIIAVLAAPDAVRNLPDERADVDGLIDHADRLVHLAHQGTPTAITINDRVVAILTDVAGVPALDMPEYPDNFEEFLTRLQDGTSPTPGLPTKHRHQRYRT